MIKCKIIKCGTCKKVLVPEKEGKTWAYFLKNSPPECFECTSTAFGILENKIKKVRKNDFI